MNASKEEAAKALECLALIEDTCGIDKDTVWPKTIRDFLIAAQRKLPSEAAYAKERKRRTKSYLQHDGQGAGGEIRLTHGGVARTLSDNKLSYRTS